MRRPRLALVLGLLLSGCAVFSPQSAKLLDRADEQMVTGEYRRALGLYDEFLKAYPTDPAAPRARATRNVLDRLLSSQAEIERLKADLERLRSIDLPREPQKR